ncbi:MAG: hypothetical protein ACFFEW_18345 [Candidatus Thorarchaeota archaeon]
MKDRIVNGAKTSLSDLIDSGPQEIEELAETISMVLTENAIEEVKGIEAVQIDDDSEDVYFIDVTKALSGIGKTLAAVASAAFGGPLLAAIVFVGSISEVRGIRNLLPREQGLVIRLLADTSNKKLDKEQLQKSYEEEVNNRPSTRISLDEFENALVALRNLGCLKTEGDLVVLKQRIVIRR